MHLHCARLDLALGVAYEARVDATHLVSIRQLGPLKEEARRLERAQVDGTKRCI